MKKTQKLIYHLRIVAEIAALISITVAIVAFVADQYAFYHQITRLWPYFAAIMAFYCGLTAGEEYLNERMLSPRS